MDKFQQADYNWLQCMMRIGRKETDCFEKDNVGYTDQLFWYHSRRQIMRWVYSTMVAKRKIIPIESLQPEDKKQMWGFINELCVGKEVSKEIRIDIAKIFYIIEYFINEQK